MAAARALLEDGGPEALSMRRLAERVGIQAPSIYKHLADKEALEVALIADGLREFAEVCETAVTGAEDPMAALSVAYRGFGLAHPHLYLINDRPPRDRLPEGREARAGAPLVAAAGHDPDRARAAWAFAHGMVMLELTGRFPPGADVEAAWTTGVRALTARPA